MSTVSRKITSARKKSPEIARLILVMDYLRIKPTDISKESEVSHRTVTNFIWNDLPIGGQLLRVLHAKFGVSLDWLLSGKGEMLLVDKDGKTNEPGADYVVNPVDDRTQRLCDFIHQFMDSASADEKIWLEMQIRLHVPHYQRFLDERGE